MRVVNVTASPTKLTEIIDAGKKHKHVEYNFNTKENIQIDFFYPKCYTYVVVLGS